MKKKKLATKFIPKKMIRYVCQHCAQSFEYIAVGPGETIPCPHCHRAQVVRQENIINK